MKIELDIPDELLKDKNGKELNLYFFAGMHHVAVKRPDRKWVVKDSLCSMCGTCCTTTHIRGMGLPIKDNKCVFLKELKDGRRICSWRLNRPFSCCIGSPIYEPKCTVSWKEVE